jgi:choline dehydrogenase-like flavoprotein
MNKTFSLNNDEVVVVIGSGAGGGTVSNELAQRGINVVCLEAGKHLDFQKDFVNDEWTMFSKTAWTDLRTTSGSWRVAKDFPNLPAWICKTVGGSTLHWAGASLRFHEYEFKTKTTYGDVKGANLLDWPITLKELEPYYDKAEDKMGVTRTHNIPGLPPSNNYKVFEAGAHKLGYKKVHTGKMAVNSEPRDGRAACRQLGFCFAGCKMGAKWSTLYTEIPKAQKTGNFELRAQAHVQTINHNKKGLISSVTYIDKNGDKKIQKARLVILAANTIESPRILLNSASKIYPKGLANSSDQVGRNYMRHMTGSVYATFPNKVNMYKGTTMAGIIEDEAIHKPSRGFVGGYKMETLSLGVPFLAAFLNPGAHGEYFADFMNQYENTAGMWLVGEDMPQKTNRITLHKSKKDQYGLPVPNVHFDDHPNDIAMRKHAYKQGSAVYKELGAINIQETPPYPSTHNLGTNRMSQKPEDGVVDKWGRTHDIKNLFIGDGSIFTSGASANPTLTIVALAIRQAQYIANEIKERKL